MKMNKRNVIKHILAMMLFCVVLNIGMVSLADVQGTVIAKSAVIRASADANSEKLASIPSGKVIDIIGKTTGTDSRTWYQVYVNSSTKGFIRGDLIKVPDGANIPTVDGGSAAPAQPADVPATTTTPVDARQVSVISNNTNIRQEASTNSPSRAKVNRGSVLTVVGEATGTDGKKWYQVSFTYGNEEKTGYIRSDLVTTDNVANDPATSQIVGEENPGEEQPQETTPPEEQPQEEQPAETNQAENNAVIPMDVDEVPYIMPGFELVTLGNGDQECKGYMNGDFYIFYAQKPNGEQGWYLFDFKEQVYQRYVYTAEGVTVPGGMDSVGLIPVIVLVVIIVILVAVIGLLLIKLKGQNSSYKRYKGYDDDDQDDDDIEDLEDLEDDEELQPSRRPQGPQPVRRPQGNVQGQPPRRPQGQQPPRHQQSQQPPRRQQGNPSNGNTPQGGQPPRRPQGGQPANNGGARPQGGQPPRRPQGNVQGQPPRRPQQPQSERVPNEKGQKGYKAKNLLEDDDMDFMDIE